MTSAKRGQSLVEFILMLPVFVLIVMIIFDFGRAIYFYSVVFNATREGARYGAVDPTNLAKIKATVRSHSYGLDPTDLVVQDPTYTYNSDGNPVTITVRVEYTFRPITAIISELWGVSTYTIRSQSNMLVEAQIGSES